MPLDLIILDMDGTIVKYEDGNFQSSWDALGRAAGVYDEFQKHVKRYYSHPELYQEWVDENCQLLQGMAMEPILNKIFPPPYACGFSAFMEYVKLWSAKKVIVSGGVDLISRKVMEEFGFDEVIANGVHVAEGRFTGTGKVNVSSEGKGEIVKGIINKYGASSARTLYLGDHLNDISAWKEVGHPLGIDLKHGDCVKHVIEHHSTFFGIIGYLERHFKKK